jgi:gliding motility-associated-like protein
VLSYSFNSGACGTDTLSQNVSVNPLPNVLLSPETLCVDIVVPVLLTIGTPAGGIYTGPGISSNFFNPAITGFGLHTILYTYADINGCSAQDTSVVLVAEVTEVQLGNDTAVKFCEGESITLAATTGPGLSYHWYTIDETSMIVAKKPGVYGVVIIDSLGCLSSDSIILREGCVETIFVPNSFSPNADGNNDFFKPEGSNFQMLGLHIFNRWGEELFNTTDPAGSWNGVAKNQLCTEGVYIYAIDYQLMLSSEVSRKVGTVTLLR